MNYSGAIFVSPVGKQPLLDSTLQVFVCFTNQQYNCALSPTRIGLELTYQTLKLVSAP